MPRIRWIPRSAATVTSSRVPPARLASSTPSGGGIRTRRWAPPAAQVGGVGVRRPAGSAYLRGPFVPAENPGRPASCGPSTDHRFARSCLVAGRLRRPGPLRPARTRQRRRARPGAAAARHGVEGPARARPAASRNANTATDGRWQEALAVTTSCPCQGNLGSWPPVKSRSTSVQGLLRTGAEDQERRRRPAGLGPRLIMPRPADAAGLLAGQRQERSNVHADRQLRQDGTVLEARRVGGHVR